MEERKQAMLFKTKHLTVIPASLDYAEDYYREFTQEICQYQYPDAFSSPEEARKLLGCFIREMEQGKMLELMLLDQNGQFVGSMEAFGLQESEIEIGLWLKKSAQGSGWGYEALAGLLEYLSRQYPRPYYVYEADERNTASVHLVKKFPVRVGKTNEITTESGKPLRLTVFHILTETAEKGD